MEPGLDPCCHLLAHSIKNMLLVWLGVSDASKVPVVNLSATISADTSRTRAPCPCGGEARKQDLCRQRGARTTSMRCVLGSLARHSRSSPGRMPRHLCRLSSGRAAGLGSASGKVVYSARSGSKEGDRKSSSAGAPTQTQQHSVQSQ